MKPPPPTPHENGSVTPRTAAAVTAASTALPPPRIVSTAACVARVSTVAAAPPLPVAVAGPCGPTSAEAAIGGARTTTPATSATAIERTTGWRIAPPCHQEAARRNSDEHVQRQQRADQEVGHVDGLADAQVDGAAAQRVGLLGVQAPRLQVVDHVQQRVAGGEGEVLARVLAVLVDADAGGRVEAARRGHLRRGEPVVAEELQVADAAPLRLALAQAEPQGRPRTDLDRRAARLAVALGIVHVAGRDQRPLGVDRSSMVTPGEVCLMSVLPAVSRGGTVRRPSA